MLKEKINLRLREIELDFVDAPLVDGATWQSINAPEPMAELHLTTFDVDLEGETRLEVFREALRPNLPWADEHFIKDRVSGDPINPGDTWKIWPYARSADTHRRSGEKDPQFDHSYAERYWPKFAGQTEGGVLKTTPPESEAWQGYRFPYGDLNDLVDVLVEDPLTRQAYLPVWFPEDLGAARLKKRVPCSLGYHFIRREDKLHVLYPMRSCDYIRHFRDDVYLTIRLLLWVLEQCQLADPENWEHITPGRFTMIISSLHMFQRDREMLVRRLKRKQS